MLTTAQDDGVYRVFVNPLLAEYLPILRAQEVQRYVQPSARTIPWTAAWSYPRASWRKMYISHPLIDTLFIESDNDEPRIEHCRATWIVDPVTKHPDEKGVTAAALLQKLAEARGTAWIEGSEFWSTFSGESDLDELWTSAGLDGDLPQLNCKI